MPYYNENVSPERCCGQPCVPTLGLAVAVALPPVNVHGDDSVYTHTVAHIKRARLTQIAKEVWGKFLYE